MFGLGVVIKASAQMRHKAACTILFLLIYFLITPSVFAEKLYRWVDPDGTVNISNTPPSENQATLETLYVAPIAPIAPIVNKTAEQDRTKATNATYKASQELAEMEIGFRAQQRRFDKIQLQLQLKLLETQGQPADSLEAYKLKQAFAENLYNQALQRIGIEKITILEEYIKMQMEMTNAVYEYKKRP